MYYPGRPPQKPWRVSRDYCGFRADHPRIKYGVWVETYRKKPAPPWQRRYRDYIPGELRVRSTRLFLTPTKKRPDHDRAMRREQRRQQRRLDRWLCDHEEWE